MRLARYIYFYAGCMCLLAARPGALNAEPLSVEDAIKLAPNLDSTNPKWRSIEIGGYIDAALNLGGEKTPRQVRLMFRSAYRAPDQFALSICDFRDETPLLFAASNKAIFYDPVRGAVVYVPDCRVQVSIFQEQDQLRFDFGITSAKTPNLRFDVSSLVTTPSRTREISKDANEANILILTTLQGNQLKAVVDPTWSCPFSKVELFKHAAVEPAIAVNRIIVDADIEDGEFAFPSRDALRKVVNVYEMPNDLSLSPGKFLGFAMVTHAMMARLAVDDHELRAKISGVDWDRVEESDAKFSKALRTMLTRENKTP